LRLIGPAKALQIVSPEGRIQAALCSRLDYAVLDRECAFRFPDEVLKATVLSQVQAPLASAVARHQAKSKLPGPPTLGQEADAIAVAADGVLEVIEIKSGDVTGRLGWTPAQVTYYAHLFNRWLAEDSSATTVLQTMLSQRVELGLSPPVQLSE